VASEPPASAWKVQLEPARGGAEQQQRWQLSLSKSQYMPLPPGLEASSLPRDGVHRSPHYVPGPPVAAGKPTPGSAAPAVWHPDVLARFYVSVGMVANVQRNGVWQPAKVLSGPKDKPGQWVVGDSATSGGAWSETVDYSRLRPLNPTRTAATAASPASSSPSAAGSGRWKLRIASGPAGKYSLNVEKPGSSGAGGAGVQAMHQQCDDLDDRITHLEDLRRQLKQETSVSTVAFLSCWLKRAPGCLCF
jgi:hypothetical protein